MKLNSYSYIPHTGRTIVVGDVHGCFTELSRLLAELDFCRDDLLILCGDFMNRGPESMELAAFIEHQPNVYSVMGNHELKLLRKITQNEAIAWSQKKLLSSLDYSDLQGLVSFLSLLPAVIETPLVTVVHARLDPSQSLKNQEIDYVCAYKSDEVIIEKDEDGIPFWYHNWRAQVNIIHIMI